MNEAKLIVLSYWLDRERPDLSNVERANLAIRMMIAGDVTIDGNGDLHLDEKARAVAAHGKPSATPAPEAAPPPPPEPARDIVAELRADLAKVTGNDDRSKARRSVIRAKLARLAPATNTGPEISDDLQTDLAAVRGRSLGEEQAKRALIREAHARRNEDKRNGR